MKYHIPYKLTSGKEEIPFTLPYCWQGVTFRQMEKVWALTQEELFDEANYVEIFTGITKDVWNKCNQIDLLFTVNNTLQFLSDHETIIAKGKEPANKFHFNGIEYRLPADLAVKSIGQYKDLLKFCIEPMMKEGESIQVCKTVPLMIAIYMQPYFDTMVNDRFSGKPGEYNFQRAKDLSEDLKDISITDALQLNAFFLQRLSASKRNTGWRGWIMKKLNLAQV